MDADEKRARWGAGPWVDEPDRVDFEVRGVPCLLLRNKHVGNWCGYAACLPGHPWHGLRFNARIPVPDRGELSIDTLKTGPLALFAEALHEDDGCVSLDILVRVHGGLTYSDKCLGEICHVPKPGEPDDVWWLGFDCGHDGDLVPHVAAFILARNPTLWLGEYRDVDYVRAETERLAAQIAKAART